MSGDRSHRVSDIEVDLEAPGWRWTGHGYFDANFGIRALEQDFSFWTWGRYGADGGSTCFYDAERRDGSALSAAVHFAPDGHCSEIPRPPRRALPRSLWAVRRETRGRRRIAATQVMAMLDAPFYSRSMVQTTIDGVPASAFTKRWTWCASGLL